MNADGPRSHGIAGRIAHAFIDSKLTPLIVIIVGPARRRGDRAAAARGGAANQGADDGRAGGHARLQREGSRGARHAADGKAALGNSRTWNTSTRPRATARASSSCGSRSAPIREASLVDAARKNCSRTSTASRTASSLPLVKPKSIDDVPILALTFHSARYDHLTLRRLVAQVDDAVKARAAGRRDDDHRRRATAGARAARSRAPRLAQPQRRRTRADAAAGATGSSAAGGLTSEQSGSPHRNRRVPHQRGGRGQRGRRRVRRTGPFICAKSRRSSMVRRSRRNYAFFGSRRGARLGAR